jgi:hypothetical protein
LVSASLENGWADLANSFLNVCKSPNQVFTGKKWDKLPRKLENSGKTGSAFFYGNGWNDLDIFL